MLRATARTGRGANSGRPAAKAVWLAGTNLKQKDVSEGVMLWESCLCIVQLVPSLRHHVPLNRKLSHRWASPYGCKRSMQRRGEFQRFSSLSNFHNSYWCFTHALLMLYSCFTFMWPSLALSPLGLSQIYLTAFMLRHKPLFTDDEMITFEKRALGLSLPCTRWRHHTNQNKWFFAATKRSLVD